jgi:hypothetical protein
MINFATSLLDSTQNRAAGSICNRSLASSSQKVATESPDGFAATLAAATADPNSVQIIPAGSPSQGSAAGQNSGAVPNVSTGPVASTNPITPWYATSAADDAYWAQQPAAVQQLRAIESEPEREQVASQLASQGYSIDVPVMVWGWDAGITTQMRESDGYTWVPSALQQNIAEAPGVFSPGLTPYNPASPPPGSISVG